MAESSRGRKAGSYNESRSDGRKSTNKEEKPRRTRIVREDRKPRTGDAKDEPRTRRSDDRKDRPVRERKNEDRERRSDDKKQPFKKEDGRKPRFIKGKENADERKSRFAKDDQKPDYSRKESPDKKFDKRRKSDSDGYKPKENKGDFKPFREDKNRTAYRTEDKQKYTDSKYKKLRLQKKELEKPDSGEMRLNKYIANSGICSRREADELIKAGLVKINGKLVIELGSKVKPDDVVTYNGQTITPDEKVYILMNKPKDYITTTDDPQKRNTVMELLDRTVKVRVFPVGRLDRNTTGVLLLTNDGDMAKRLIHPSSNKKKIYHVFLDKKIKSEQLRTLVEGITLDDGFIKADAVQYADPEDKTQVGVEIHSGKYHIIKRMFEHLEYKVVKLDRVYFAGLTKKGLNRGQWRFLSEKEINMLKMGAFD
ncbi:MAG: pseudouridine synthase [Bacteroidetes bacterium HGW-Bacteroidetes-21]|nr:MAG: pseudouridine synthase [Bacteroidetes bacterium HGW-Bacteroidetes-21]